LCLRGSGESPRDGTGFYPEELLVLADSVRQPRQPRRAWLYQVKLPVGAWQPIVQCSGHAQWWPVLIAMPARQTWPTSVRVPRPRPRTRTVPPRFPWSAARGCTRRPDRAHRRKACLVRAGSCASTLSMPSAAVSPPPRPSPRASETAGLRARSWPAAGGTGLLILTTSIIDPPVRNAAARPAAVPAVEHAEAEGPSIIVPGKAMNPRRCPRRSPVCAVPSFSPSTRTARRRKWASSPISRSGGITPVTLTSSAARDHCGLCLS